MAFTRLRTDFVPLAVAACPTGGAAGQHGSSTAQTGPVPRPLGALLIVEGRIAAMSASAQRKAPSDARHIRTGDDPAAQASLDAGPLADIDDARRTDRVIRGGTVYEP